MHRLALGFVAMVSLASVAQANAISEDDLRPHIEILASDAFEGREPGTEGERKTTAYISQQWKKAGLKNQRSISGMQVVFLTGQFAKRHILFVLPGRKDQLHPV